MLSEIHINGIVRRCQLLSALLFCPCCYNRDGKGLNAILENEVQNIYKAWWVLLSIEVLVFCHHENHLHVVGGTVNYHNMKQECDIYLKKNQVIY